MSLSQALRVGQRVRLRDGVKGPSSREGVVIELRPWQGGALVRHDQPDFDLEAAVGRVVEKATGDGYDFSVWGWTHDEIEPTEFPS